MDQGQGPASFRKAAEGIGAPSVPQGITQGQHPQSAKTTAVPIPRTHTFFLKHISSFDGQYYEGQFACRKMSIRDIGRISVRKVQLNGGFHYDEKNPGCGIDEETDTIHNMISHLEIALIQWPPWWNIDEIENPDVLRVVFNECVTFENSFLSRRDASRPGGSVSDDRGSEGSGSGSDRSVETVGRSEVQDSLEP